MGEPPRFVLIDDHALFREGLGHLLRGFSPAAEILEAEGLHDLADIPRPGDVDLVLLDYHLPGVAGLEALAQARQFFESATIVVVSGEDDPATIRAVIQAGAGGFIPKSSSSRVLIAALSLVTAGGTYLPPEILHNAPDEAARRQTEEESKDAPLQMLSERQREVLRRAIQGKANKVIARELNISDHTVKVHLSLALKTLGVKNRTEAVYAAAKWGLE